MKKYLDEIEVIMCGFEDSNYNDDNELFDEMCEAERKLKAVLTDEQIVMFENVLLKYENCMYQEECDLVRFVLDYLKKINRDE